MTFIEQLEAFLAEKGWSIATECEDGRCEHGGHLHPVGQAQWMDLAKKIMTVDAVDWKVELAKWLKEHE